MIQPATLPATGNLLMVLGLPVEAAAQPADFGEFSSLLAAQLEAETQAANSPAVPTKPAIAAATGKRSGKPDGKGLPHLVAAAVRAVPLVEDGVAADLKAMTEPDGETRAEMPSAEVAVAPVILPQANPFATTRHKPAGALAALSDFRPSAKAAQRIAPQGPSLAQPQLRAVVASPAVVRGATHPIPAALLAAELMPPPQPISLLGISAISPVIVATVKAALLIRAAPFVADPATGIPVNLAPGDAVPMPLAPSLPSTPQRLAATPRPAPTDAPADDRSVEAPALLPVDAAISPAATEIPSLATPLTLSQTPSQPSHNAPQVAAQPPAAAQPPQDFAALIDRLIEARDVARTSLAPGTVYAAVAHAEFGQVSLQFQQEGGGLTVAMASGDPEFARAVQAAAPAGQTSPGSDNSAQQRHDAPGANLAQSGSQQRGQSPFRETGEPRTSANPGQHRRGGDEPPARSGIFA